MARDDKSSYYDAGGIETLDIIKAKLTPEQFSGYLLGNSIKYACRMMFKTPSPLRDAEKTANYSQWHLEYLQERQHERETKESTRSSTSRNDVNGEESIYRDVEGMPSISSSD